jgi:hypothetical protein
MPVAPALHVNFDATSDLTLRHARLEHVDTPMIE